MGAKKKCTVTPLPDRNDLVPTSIRIRRRTLERLKREAASTGRDVAELIREGLEIAQTLKQEIGSVVLEDMGEGEGIEHKFIHTLLFQTENNILNAFEKTTGDLETLSDTFSRHIRTVSKEKKAQREHSSEINATLSTLLEKVEALSLASDSTPSEPRTRQEALETLGASVKRITGTVLPSSFWLGLILNTHSKLSNISATQQQSLQSVGDDWVNKR